MLSIIFDIQALKLLTSVVFFLKSKVFELHCVTRKLFLYPVYVLCLVGFFFHVMFIFGQIQNSELVFSNYYEELEYQPMPEINFCFHHEVGQAVDSEQLSDEDDLTGNDLEKLTGDIRVDSVFRSIRYLSSSEKGWIQVDLKGVPVNRFQRQNVTFRRLYFSSDKKCLSVLVNQTYHRSQFYFEGRSIIFKRLCDL